MRSILAICVAAVLFVFGMVAWNYSAAEMEIARARADAIRTEASANAKATIIMALLPWGIILAIGVPVTILAIRWKPQSRIIERQILYLPPLEMNRREVWRQLVEMNDKEKVVIER